MKLFLKKLILYALFTLLLIMGFQALISLRIKGRSLRGYDNLEQTANINADLVFIGSSRCWVHFDPEFFDTAFHLKSVNIGVDGHSEISMAITRLMDYLSRNKSPRFAILSFDPFMNAVNPSDKGNFYLKEDFARYAFLPAKKDLLMVDYFKFNWGEKFIPLYSIFKYRLLSDCIFQNHTINYNRYGYEKHTDKWDTIARPVTGIMNKYYFRDKEINAISNLLDSLNHLCINNGIRLICIQTPVYKIIRDDAAFQKTRAICLNENIPFIDVNKAYISNNIDYFYNSFHLNTSGVAEMNQLLKKDSLLTSILWP